MDIISKCRICASESLEDVIDLGDQYITSRFPLIGDFSTPKCPITLCLCGECGLLQLRQTTHASELYEYEYGYRSGISNTMKTHLKEYHEELFGKILDWKKGDLVLDIGSNDSTFLKFYPKDLVRVGIDPTGKQFSHFYTDETLIPDYFTSKNFRSRFPTEKCKVVSSIAMFYDLPDPVQFASDIESILEDDGVWTCEQSYLLNMLDTNSIDTICHEHLEYYALSQIKEIADRSRLKIIDIKFNSSNGGSFRIYFAKQASTQHTECSNLINEILLKEQNYAIREAETYHRFHEKCADEARRLKMLIQSINKNGKRVSIYGASTKGNCTLQFANITKEDVPYAVERNPKKFGKMTPTGTEIISEEEMREDPPEYLLVLPWHFRKEIIERENIFLENGGSFIFPFPNLDIFSLKPKLLLTGCDGHIASYFLDLYKDQYNIFGIGHTEKTQSNNSITKFYVGNHDDNLLCDCILAVNPQYIVHLAGISNSQTAMENPIPTLDVNGRMIAVICDCVYQNDLSTKIFNASSSEIFKGHSEYTVRGDDNYYHNLHPYSISKIMGHSFVDFYRQKYDFPFYNGIIFTTESSRKSKEFLLNKLAYHSHQWLNNKMPIQIGCLSSRRNIVHGSDVAHAIHRILMDGNSNYVICHDKSYSIEELVIDLYKQVGIQLKKKNNYYVHSGTDEIVLIVDENNKRNETPNNIQGDNSFLRDIGWEPQMTITDILQEISTHHRH
jgi:GDP-D-mannose dehydratase